MLNRILVRSGLLWVVGLCIGCASMLSIGQVDRNAKCVDGIAVNKRAAYAVSIEVHQDSGLHGDKFTKNGVAVGPDPLHVATVDAIRMPFASNKLTVKLTKDQVLKEVALESQTGASRAADAAKSGVETATTIKNLKTEENEEVETE